MAKAAKEVKDEALEKTLLPKLMSGEVRVGNMETIEPTAV